MGSATIGSRGLNAARSEVLDMMIGGRAHSLEDIAAIGTLNLPFAEISLADLDQVERDFEPLLRLREEYHLSYLGHGPEEGNPRDTEKQRRNLLPKVCSLLDWAKRLEITLFTIHFWLDARFVPKETVLKKLELLEEMNDHAAANGVVLSIENLSETSEDFSIVFERLPGVGLTLDIGHGELMRGENTAYGFMHDFPDRIKHVHAHDNRGGNLPRDDLHLPIGEGIIDYSSILAGLRETGYDQTITLEIKPSFMVEGKREIEKRLLTHT